MSRSMGTGTTGADARRMQRVLDQMREELRRLTAKVEAQAKRIKALEEAQEQ